MAKQHPPDYIYRTMHWRSLKRLAWRRSAGLCEQCTAVLIRGQAHLHHLTYDRAGDELPEDVQLICVSCHERIHGRTVRITARAARLVKPIRFGGISYVVGKGTPVLEIERYRIRLDGVFWKIPMGEWKAVTPSEARALHLPGHRSPNRHGKPHKVGRTKAQRLAAFEGRVATPLVRKPGRRRPGGAALLVTPPPLAPPPPPLTSHRGRGRGLGKSKSKPKQRPRQSMPYRDEGMVR